MVEVEQAVRALAERQFGLVTHEQVRTLGLGRHAMDWRIARGVWQRVYRGVYRLSGTPVTWHQRARAATMLAGTGSALSHRTAAFLFKLDGVPPRPSDEIELTVPVRRGEIPLPGLRVHRSQRPARRLLLRGHPVVALAETLCDLAGLLTPLDLEITLDSAHRLYPSSVGWLARHLDRTHVRGVPGIAGLRELLTHRLDGATDSALEVRVRRALRTADLPPWRRQLELHDAAGFIMRVDFAWPAQRVALHVDGYRWHHQRERFERDASQRARLTALGWSSLSVTSRGLASGDWLSALRTTLSTRAPQLDLPLPFAAAPARQTG